MIDREPGVISSVVARLSTRFDGVPASVVERVVEECYASLEAGARVSSYLPILAERAAAERLDALARRIPQTGADTPHET